MANIANAFAQGVNSGATLQANRRARLAYNALRQTYGDIAGDPEAAASLQKTAQTEQLFPVALEQQKATLADTNAQAEQRQAKSDQDKSAARAAATGRALDLLSNTAKQGGDIGAAFDRITPILPSLGVDPAHAGPLRDYLVNNPNGIQELSSAFETQQKGADIVTVQQKDGSIVRVNKVTGEASPVVGQNGEAVQGYQAPAAFERIGVAQQNADQGGQRNVLAAGTLQERVRHNQATEAAATERIAAAAKGGATIEDIDPETRQYMVDQVKAGIPLAQVVPGYGTASARLRMSVLKDVAGSGVSGDEVASAQNDYRAQTAYRRALTGTSPNSAGGRIKSADAVVAHLDTLDKYIDALGNGSVVAANAFAQEYKSQTGQAAPTQFDAQRAIVASELARFLTNNGGGVKDRDELRATLSRANSPAQLRAVMQTWRDDILGQLEPQRIQAQATNSEQQFDALLSPRTRTLLKSHDAPAAAPKAAGAPQFEEGKVYVDRKGNRARYVKGKFVGAD